MVKIIMTVEQAKAAMDLYRAAKAIYGRPTPPSRAHLLKELKEAIEAFEKVNGGVFGQDDTATGKATFGAFGS